MKELKQIDADTLRSALELYSSELSSSKKCDDLACMYSDMLNEETGVKGISFNEKITMSTINLTPYQNELILMEASCSQESRNHLAKAEEIRKMYRFDERIVKLHKRDKKILNDVFFLCISRKILASQLEKSEKTISEYISFAIKHMAEVEL